MENVTNGIKYWFCKNCNKNFKLSPWKDYKDIAITELCCPFCNSKSIFYSISLTKAIIAKKSTNELLDIIAMDDQKIRKYLEPSE